MMIEERGKESAHRMIQRQITATRAAPRRQVRARSAAARPAVNSSASPELRAMLEAMPDAVLVCDSDERVRLVNPAADRLFAGRPVRDRADLLGRFEPLPTDPAHDETVTLRPRDVPDRWYELRSFPVDRQSQAADDGRGGRVLVIRDVTEARLARAQRRAFLSILSHELRTPITTIYAGSRVLARQSRKPAAEGSENAVGTAPAAAGAIAGPEIAADISAEAAHLYDLVEDLLVLTRAEQGLLDLSIEPVLLQRIVETSMRLAATRTPGVTIVRAGTNDPPAVRGDPVYLEQVIRNLVTAASHYASVDEPVIIGMSADDREVTVRVLDRGPDLRPRDAERLLELVEEPRGSRQSAGIGPFVCRRIVESMGGRIWVTPRRDGGAEIGFALPRYEDAADEGMTA
jgi:signal transduction histidine kinase